MEKSINSRIIYNRKKRGSTTTNGTVEIEISYDRKRIWLTTGVHIKTTEWNGDVVVKRKDCYALNKKIKKLWTEIQARIAQMELDGDHDITKLKMLSGGDEPSIALADWLWSREESRDLAYGTRKHHRAAINNFLDSGLFKTFSDITPMNLMKWDDMLRERGIEQCSIHSYHKRIKPYIRQAVSVGLLKSNPYDRFKVERGKTAIRKYLTDVEKKQFEEIVLTTAKANKARDMFIFACYTGLSYSDITKIRKGDIIAENGRYHIIDTRQKTGTEYRITMLPKAMEILEKYDYNLKLLSDQGCNVELKKIAERLGINKNVTMHVGRHTFATWALKSGVRIEVVSKMLAHSDIKTTQIYAKILQSEVDDGFDILSGK